MLNASARSILVFGLVSALAAACGPTVLRDQHGVKFKTGGQVVYGGDTTIVLPGVAVTLTDTDGIVTTANTDSSGLWTMKNLLPGVYAARYELAGYEPLLTSLELDAFGSNEVSNPFIAAGTIQLNEISLTATFAPFGTVLTNGQQLFDGVGGNVLTYSVTNDGAISVTFPQRVFAGQVRLTDGETGQQIDATLDTANGTSFTFSKIEIDNINGGGGGGGNALTADNNPFTWHRIQVQNVETFSPIHGTLRQINATAWFNATP